MSEVLRKYFKMMDSVYLNFKGCLIDGKWYQYSAVTRDSELDLHSIITREVIDDVYNELVSCIGLDVDVTNIVVWYTEKYQELLRKKIEWLWDEHDIPGELDICHVFNGPEGIYEIHVTPVFSAIETTPLPNTDGDILVGEHPTLGRCLFWYDPKSKALKSTYITPEMNTMMLVDEPKMEFIRVENGFTIKFRDEVKVEIHPANEGLLIDGVLTVIDTHEQDCCENNYVNWISLKDSLIDGAIVKQLTFTQDTACEVDTVVRVNGEMLNCYSDQNGYYDDSVYIEVLGTNRGYNFSCKVLEH